MNCNDLRFVKTEENLKASLLHLLENQRMENISIRALCAEAKCSRNAFYQHYQSKDELYCAILSDFFYTIEKSTHPIELDQSAMNEQKIREFTFKLLKVIDEYRGKFVSLRIGCDLFLSFLSESLYRAFLQQYALVDKNMRIPKEGELLTKYFCCGIAGFIEQWLMDGDISLEEAQYNLDLCARDNFRKMRDVILSAQSVPIYSNL